MGILKALFGSAQNDAPSDHLRVDGVYQAPANGVWTYLKFNSDGEVFYGSSPCTPEEMGAALSREGMAGKWAGGHLTWAGGNIPPVGRYEKQGDRLNFRITSAAGSVDFEGQIRTDRLVLNSHSHINGNRTQRSFRFIPLQS